MAAIGFPFFLVLSAIRQLVVVFVLSSSIFALPLIVQCNTDPSDVQALQVMYSSLNSPSQLTDWKSDGGDPCAESWKGITCEGSAVVSIQISGLGLSGTMGYLLSNLMSLRKFDLSDNSIHDTLPYQLPPNVTSLNLARNNFTGNLPYSLSTMASLAYLNVSHNSISQSVGDVFANLAHLGILDLSFNNFSGDLPSSFGSLPNLTLLYVQNNELTGSLDVLSDLPLATLNVANNHFSGWIPQELISLPTFIYNGNSFDNGPAPPLPPYTPPPPGRIRSNHRHPGSSAHTSPSSDAQPSESDNGLSTRAIVGIILGSTFFVFIVLLLIVVCIRKNRRKDVGALASNGSQSAGTTDI